jgi:cobalt-precorrin 5A hydrolase/precorrin-3B C17-methyltransferase
MTGTPALVALTPRGLALAQRLAATLPGAAVHASRGAGAADVAIERVGAHLRGLFETGTPIVGLCAAGILIRAVAPLLADKSAEPPVLALADDGSAVVPLLGGHHGANRLARQLAEVLGIAASLTTASELAFAGALDEPPPGYRLAAGSDVKAVSAALLAGEPVHLVLEAGDAPWLRAAGLGPRPEARARVVVTERAIAPAEREIAFHPAVLALGVGCSRGAAPAALIGLIEAALREAALAPASIAGLFSLERKLDEPAMHAAAAHYGVPFRVFDAATLAAEADRLRTPSLEVERAVGLRGVAEAAALAAVGRSGRLIVPKRSTSDATCAIALASAPIEAAQLGAGRGRLAVVGIGPGAASWRTPEASALIAAADDIVGYSLYLDLIGPLGSAARRHPYELGEETLRVDAALALAARGRQVALVSSGDAGIYGMAALALERLEAGSEAYRGVEFVVAPGVSALLAAAARAGAPLGHDFCALSLSDLLTPRAVIERRLEAALAGDFALALFNPAGSERRALLDHALARLRAVRGADVPVVHARSLGRAREEVVITTLGALDAATVDMLSLLLIGNASSRRVHHAGRDHVLTPRGYAAAAGRR